MAKQELQIFGQHLTVDAYGAAPKALANLSLVARFLDELPDLIKMTKIMPPYVFPYQGKEPEDWGISGVVLIAESHISLHTFPEKGFLSLDIFSCKPFDPGPVLHKAQQFFCFTQVEKRFFDRGLDFPRSPEAVAARVRAERERVGEKEA